MTNHQKDHTEIVLFLDNKGTNHSSKTFSDILSMSNEDLENVHDYIQWLFPLKEQSQFATNAPRLSDSDIKQIKSSASIQSNLHKALDRMVSFYANTNHWLCEHDHNHLRITRIIKSLILLTGIDEAEFFYDVIIDQVIQSKNKVSPDSIKYWEDALGISIKPS